MSSDPPLPPESRPLAPGKRRLQRVWLWSSAAVPALALGLAAGGALWALATTDGARWALERVPGLDVGPVQGTWLDGLKVERLAWAAHPDAPATGTRVEVEALELSPPRLSLTPSPSTWGAVWIERLHVGAVRVTTASTAPGAAPRLPTSLALPLELAIGSVAVDALHLPGVVDPVQNLRGGLHLGSGGGTLHRISGFDARWRGLRARADGQIGVAAPLPLDADLRLEAVLPEAPANVEAPPAPGIGAAWKAQLKATGPLAAFEVNGELTAQGQSLGAQALVAPAAPWPLPRLDLQVQALDLSALSAAMAPTALTGRIQVQPVDATALRPDEPLAPPELRDPRRRELRVQVDLRNALPRAGSEAGLPFSELVLEALLDGNDPASGVSVRTLRARIADALGSAGTVDGSGSWQPDGGSADLRLDALRLQALDARLPAMRLGGPLRARVSGLNGPADQTRVEAAADLSGLGQDARRGVAPVALRGQLQAGWQTIDLRGLNLRVGSATAEGQLNARRRITSAPVAAPAAPAPSGSPSGEPALFADIVKRLAAARADAWDAEVEVRLAGFDPGDWLPGPPNSLWRQRASRLTGEARGGIQWPSARGGTPSTSEPLALRLARSEGEGSFRLDGGSELLGVPVRADVRGARPVGTDTLQFSGRVDAAGNRLRFDGRRALLPAGAKPQGPVPARTEADQLNFTLEADALATLRPWWRAAMAGQPAAEMKLGGALRLDLAASGNWPLMRAEGSLRANALRVGTSSVNRAEGRLRGGPQAGEPLLGELEFQTARRAGQTLDRGRLRVEGNLQEHRLELEVLARAVPPEALRLLGTAEPLARPDERSLWSLQAAGGWRRLAEGAVAARTGQAASATSAAAPAGLHPALAAWLEGQPTRWTVQDLRARVSPARAGTSTPAAPALPGLPAEWLGAQAESVAVDIPGRVLEPAAGASSAPAVHPSAWQLRLGPGQLRSAAATLRWSTVAWQQTLPGRAGAFEADVRLDPVEMAPLLQRLQPGFGWGGDLVIGGRLEARSGADPARDLQFDLQVERRGGDLFVDESGLRQALGLSELRLAATARNGVWTFDLGALGNRLGRLQGNATLDAEAGSLWPGASSPLRGKLLTQVADLGVWGAWVPAGWRLGGQLRSEVDLGGTLGERRFNGELRGESLSVRNPLQGVFITDGQVLVRLRGDRADIETARARAGSGTVVITGGTTLTTGAPVTDLIVVAEQFQLLGRVDRRIVTSGRGRVQIAPKQLTVDGRFGVDEGLIDFSRRDAPSLSDDVVIDGQAEPEDAGEARSAVATNAPMRLAMDLQIDLGERLRVRGRGLDAALRGMLRITAPAGRLALNGTVQAVDGTYAAYGQRLVISRGNVVFNGPADNPRLDIQATRPNLDVVVGVSIVGPAVAPRVRLFSEPEMSETEKLSWLMLGRGSDGLGRTDAALLQRAAFALLAGEDGGSRDPISNLLGLDNLSISQVEGEDTRDTVLTLGKQLNRRWYVGYERSLVAATGSFQLIYRLAQRFTLRAQSGEDNSLDLIWTWRWQ